MTMHVGLKTGPSAASPAFQRGGIDAPGAAQRTTAVQTTAARSAFPEAALLSRRPLRYNVQLNQQLTAVQQADDYLARTETRLLLLRQAAGQEERNRQSSGLQTHLSERSRLSGGTVDCQLNVALERQNSVSFSVSGMDKLLSDPGAETLLFALGGRERQLAAVTLPPEGLPGQVLTRLNTGLGRFGIHASRDAVGQLAFQVAESEWERVSQHLSVRGEGHNYPADAFTLLAPQRASDRVTLLTAPLARGEMPPAASAQTALNHITAQRSQLRQQQDRVALRISDMAVRFSPAQALETAAALGKTLASSGSHYATLSAALGAQANVHSATVKNLLG